MSLPVDLANNPLLNTWLDLAGDGTITVRVGKVEIGQGILSALAQIAAEELDVRVDRITMMPACTAASPDESVTAGSLSIMFSGAALRQACAEARALFCTEAARTLGVPAEELRVEDGTIIHPRSGARLTYWQLDRPGLLNRVAEGKTTPKSSAEHRIVGTNVPRRDLPDKVIGAPRFIQDLRLPDQLYGRVVRPPSRGARLCDLDAAVTTGFTDVTVVRDGDFLGVVADDERTALAAAAALESAAIWDESPTLPGDDAVSEFLRSAPAERTTLAEPDRDDEPEQAVVRRLRSSYTRPYLAHASIAPSCAVARWNGDVLTVWTHSQGVFGLRDAICQVLSLPRDDVVVHHVEGAGCYGHNAADDAAFDAVLLARAVRGHPVQVLWSRTDELTWAPLGAAMVADVEASIDTEGHIVEWRYEVWSNGHSSRPGYAGTPGFLATTHTAASTELPAAIDVPAELSGGSLRNALPYYDLPSLFVAGNRVLSMPLRVSSLRSLGAFLNVYAIESFMDELAGASDVDPVEFRLRHLTDARARAVVEAAAEAASWSTARSTDGDVGRGFGFARYKNRAAFCAVVAEVEATHQVKVNRLYVAIDAGQLVNPDGVANQVEGGAVQATSWTLKERVRFDHTHVTSGDWESYPILRFSEVPPVDVRLMPRPCDPSLGVGEAAQGPTAAAIGNAVTNALGVRVRDLPLTPERIRAQL